MVVGEVLGTGTAVVPSEPVDVLKVYDGVVSTEPADGAGVPMVVPGESVVADGVSTVVPGVVAAGVSTVVLGVAAAGVSTGVCVSDASDSRDSEALESTEENSEANELETAESVAVATMLDSSSLRDEAMLANADGVVVALSAEGVAVALSADGVGAEPVSVVSTLPRPSVACERAVVMAPERADDGA